MSYETRIAAHGHDLLGESPFWDAVDQALTWVDIYGRQIHRLHPATGARQLWSMPDRVATAIPRAHGGMLVALSRSLHMFEPATGLAAAFFSLDQAGPGIRFNDARTDSHGRLWIGTMNEADEVRTGALYRIDADLGCTRIEQGIAISNGIGFSPDNTRFYFADTPERVIRAYDFDSAAGTIGNRRDLIIVDGDSAYPDGSTVDREGYIWNAQWEGSRVVRYAPDGRIDAVLTLPVSRPTCCVFGGADLRTLYVTSACMELTGAELRTQPLAGSLFAIETDATGIACTRFAG
ncbi:SMP-30/gluconolactonase/LRE family protein [Lichenicoccus sp.]|uniref:SMP-30/gluconolactonase/LRE family protein n=1 Tax=Lichenicoccus sp. TaxID=2781899 RepID=UPI003D14E905